MIKTKTMHTVLFALFPLFFLAANNIEQISIDALILPVVIILLLYRTAGHLFGFVFKNSEKKAILLSFCILIFFSYVHFYSLISRFELNGFTIARNQDGMIAYALFFVLVSCPLLKLTVKRAKNITPALNYIALALVSISLFNIAAYEINHFMAFGEKSNENKVLFNESLEVPEVAPDIYYIILDRYAPSSTLKEYYGYDNSKFIEYLTDKGFYIANESLANYPKTHLSLASSLNMKHLLYLSEMLGENSKDTNIANNMMKDHKVWGLLKEKNYTFIHFGTWWEPTRKNEYADININYYALEMNEFHKELLKTTAIYPFINKILFKKEQWTRELYKFDQLEEMPEIEEPKFVFAHFLVTHDPYSFTREGDLLENTGQNEKELYIEQVIFLEKKLRFLTDALISKSERPVIIILQSDEGPFTPEFGEHGGAGIDWTTLSDESLQVHMRIFNAIYIPQNDKKIFYNELSPVNSFRIIFNEYFNANYSLLNDRSYIFEDLQYPYNYIDITEKVIYH